MTSEEKLKFRKEAYKNTDDAKSWLDGNIDRVYRMFSETRLRDYLFEPFKGVFRTGGNDSEARIHSVITQVALVNAVLAALPGKMGIGVAVSMALEGWMAYCIAREVGIRIAKPSDIWKYFGLIAAVLGTILWLFKQILGVAYSVISATGVGIPVMFPAELLTTNLVGVLFWLGFEEARRSGSFTIPLRMAKRAWDMTMDLFRHQWDVLAGSVNPANLKKVGLRLHAWLTGEIPAATERLRGELMATAAMGWLISRESARFDGPLGEVFLESVRARYPDLADASVGEISSHFAEYSPEQLAGVSNLLKGEMFERLVLKAENTDADNISASLHESRNHPGSDIIFANSSTGEEIEISLKATDNPAYIENALVRYPEYSIMTTEEVATVFGDNVAVMGSSISNAELNHITSENLDQILAGMGTLDSVGVAGAGVGAAGAVQLWPFVVAYMRGRIAKDELTVAFERLMGESGRSLASRVAWSVVYGPLFAWYLLARGTMGAVQAAEGTVQPKRMKLDLAVPRTA